MVWVTHLQVRTYLSVKMFRRRILQVCLPFSFFVFSLLLYSYLILFSLVIFSVKQVLFLLNVSLRFFRLLSKEFFISWEFYCLLVIIIFIQLTLYYLFSINNTELIFIWCYNLYFFPENSSTFGLCQDINKMSRLNVI